MDSLVPSTEPEEPITVTPDQIIYQRRVRVMEHARRTSVSEACRTFGVSRTTFYRWQHRVETGGLEALMPKGRRLPAMPNQTPAWVVDELLAEAVVRPTLGARRYADGMRHRGFVISSSGVQKILGRHGLGRRRQRVAALAQLSAATTGLLADDARDGPFGFCHFRGPAR
jgi:transposase